MAAVSYAGDTIPGHPPIALAPAPSRARAGILLGVVALIVGLVARARATPGLVVDVAGAALVVAGLAVWFGTGPALVAAGVAVLAISSYGDTATRPDGP